MDRRNLAVIGAPETNLAFAMRLYDRRQKIIFLLSLPRRVEAESKHRSMSRSLARPGRRVEAAGKPTDLSVVAMAVAEPRGEECRGIVQADDARPRPSFATGRLSWPRRPWSPRGESREQRDLQVILQMLPTWGE